MYLGHQRLLYPRQIKISHWYLQQPAPAPIENHCVLPWRWITDILLKDKSCISRVKKYHLTKHSSWLNLEQEKTWPKNILWLWAQGIFPFGVNLVQFHSCGAAASQHFILGWKVNSNCLVVESNEHFSVTNLLDLSTVFKIVDYYLFLIHCLAYLFPF